MDILTAAAIVIGLVIAAPTICDLVDVITEMTADETEEA